MNEVLQSPPPIPHEQLTTLGDQPSAVRERPNSGRDPHRCIERHAAAAPGATALVFREQTLTYGELNRRANRLAHFLAERGIGRESRVVVCLEPSLEIAVALLGILKAGAVYVPLDPSYPAARLRAILDDTEPALVLSQSRLLSRPELAERPVLALDAPPPGYAELAQSDPQTSIAPEQTAYIFYTSGTTGSPKGVMASYANLRHYVRSACERYELASSDVMPALARFSFSISLFELCAPLAAGGKLVILEREHVLDPARLARTLEQVTIFHAGPSLLKGLVAYVRSHYRDFSAFSRVRHASSGGDMVPPELLEALKQIFTNAEVFVIYGCSEIACMGCTYPVPRDVTLAKTFVGLPFAGVELRLLDESGREAAAGSVGEICFAGGGVSKGYLKRPELTLEKFVELGGERFYRTGDCGRLGPEGLLEMLGRSDFQVKLRGMRVELSEVELELRRAPGVRDAVAAAKLAHDQEKVLVAYVVLEPVADGGPSERAQRLQRIRQHMAEQLPDYMQPAVYVVLAALPLNFNLKLDRKALPEPSEADLRALSSACVREPSSASERALARIWQRLLGLERVGRDDNFFELGGHSMLAVVLALEVEDALSATLTGMEILREPLSVLAALCDQRRGDALELVPTPAAVPAAGELVEIFHFGQARELYGALHAAPAPSERAVLICGPLGQEGVRARFVLGRLAKRLAEAGVPALRFDYFACGDSLGEVAAPGRWQVDIAEAHAELVRRSGATRITAIGVRLGGLLLADAARELGLAKLVLWDAVSDGSAHLAELGAMQRRYLRSVADIRFWRLFGKGAEDCELLGTRYAADTRRALAELSLEPLLARQTARVERAQVACHWSEVAELEDVLPDLRISSMLAQLALEER